jgi:hypothetical protein
MRFSSQRSRADQTSTRKPGMGLAVIASAIFAAGCASTAAAPGTVISMDGSTVGTSLSPATAGLSVRAPSPDPRVGLRAGVWDAQQASWNMRLVSTTPPSARFTNPAVPGDGRFTSSDFAFIGNYVIQGNYSGHQIWDVSNPARPVLAGSYLCPGAQNDASVYRNLLFLSAEATSGRTDCSTEGVRDTVSMDRARGVRIFDISDIRNPRPITTVQTCRGSHTNTLVSDPTDPNHVYIYVSGSSSVRSPSELPGCSSGTMAQNPNTAQFRLEVIQVPLANPARSRVVSSPRVFNDLTAPPRGERGAGADTPGAAARPGPTQCHDITVYPAVGLAGGACGGYGLLLDIRDVKNPVRINAVADSNMSFWHSATFSNDGRKLLFSDEWGGGRGARCRVTDRPEWGANTIFTLDGSRMTFQSYFKLPAPQTEFENCVAHNGSLIPIPGRDVMVQSWYQGGINVFDWTDPANPVEIAFFDRGPMDSTRLITGGHWSAYWYNGYIYGSEEYRGLDILELTPNEYITQNEIDAAKLVRMDHFNPQEQPRFEWPPHFVVVRALLDQVARTNGLNSTRRSEVSRDLGAAEGMTGAGRSAALTALAAQLDRDAMQSPDAARVRMMATAVRQLAAQR